MRIEELLKKDFPHTRVSRNDRWLYWDGEEWVVLEREYRARDNTCHYRGKYLEKAISSLLGGEK
ncbi:hypothetical protein LCGC14_1368230 [marine sediment metagenome]|uniref:Uncharacterized protein n=1 Tax=marine sediment metagenome TaxID=412755 RepID=A0A0F9N836_9ZZZZ